MQQCTIITYENGKKAIIYRQDPVVSSYGVSTISYPVLTTEQIKEIEEAATEKVQAILSKY